MARMETKRNACRVLPGKLKGDLLEDLVVMGKMGWVQTRSSGKGYRYVAGSCEQGNEPPDYIHFS